jgi:hypothetical protein
LTFRRAARIKRGTTKRHELPMLHKREELKMLTEQEAYYIASQWGSYMRIGDPGACFYGFHVDDARPVDENHRQLCLAHTDTVIQRLETDLAWGTAHEEQAQDLDDLKALKHWFKHCELHS